ncbi:MAG: polysaccharide deacetylase family protein [Eubacteriales bacterium]
MERKKKLRNNSKYYQITNKEKRKLFLSPVQKISRLATDSRRCALVFQGGPCALPSPKGGELSLTEEILAMLKKYEAKATFAVIGSTAENYPDTLGKVGSIHWNGVKYDHIPDMNRDDQGGAVACPDLVKEILERGNEIASQGYRAIPCGKNPARREFFGNYKEVLEDLERLHSHFKENHQYEIKLAMPLLGATEITKGMSILAPYGQMGYQMLAPMVDGTFSCAGKNHGDACVGQWETIRQLLEEDGDCFCGQLFALPHGFNSMGRAPVLEGLEKLLQILDDFGYRVETVSQLLEDSPFADVELDVNSAQLARKLLAKDKVLLYQDNTLRLYHLLTRGELAMVFFGNQTRETQISYSEDSKSEFPDISTHHPYRAAIEYAVEQGYLMPRGRRFQSEDLVSATDFNLFCDQYYGVQCTLTGDSLTHRALIKTLHHLEN